MAVLERTRKCGLSWFCQVTSMSALSLLSVLKREQLFLRVGSRVPSLRAHLRSSDPRWALDTVLGEAAPGQRPGPPGPQKAPVCLEWVPGGPAVPRLPRPAKPKEKRLFSEVRMEPPRRRAKLLSVFPLNRSGFSPTCPGRAHPAILKFLWLWVL